MIIDKFKSILKNHPDKTAIIFKEFGHIVVKNFEELYYDMFRMISYLENKGLKPGNKIALQYKNNYCTILLLLSALYRNYEVSFFDNKLNVSSDTVFDFYCGDNLIDSIFKPKGCKKAVNLKNYIYGDKEEIGFGYNQSFKMTIHYKNDVKILTENELDILCNMNKDIIYHQHDIGCMISDSLFIALLNILYGCPTFIISKIGLIFGNKIIIDGAVDTCFLNKDNLKRINDKKQLIRKIFYTSEDILNSTNKFRKAEFIEVNLGNLEVNQ